MMSLPLELKIFLFVISILISDFISLLADFIFFYFSYLVKGGEGSV